MYEVSVIKEISASQQLHNYKGPCARLHGHNWKIRVDVVTEKVDVTGISIDFEDLEKLLWQVVGKFDHNHFNVVAPFDSINPTAENISRYIFEEMAQQLPESIQLKKVFLWENDRYVVSYSS